MAMNHYTGKLNGSVQTTVHDMMGQAYPGVLANASDYNLVDSMICVEDGIDGLVAGLGCIRSHSAGQMAAINEYVVRAPITGDDATAFGGIVVRTHQMKTNAKGQPAVDEGQMASVLRNVRAGGRVWVTNYRGAAAAEGAVYMVVDSATPETLPNGAFVADGGADAVEIPGLKWVAATAAGTLNQIECLG